MTQYSNKNENRATNRRFMETKSYIHNPENVNISNIQTDIPEETTASNTAVFQNTDTKDSQKNSTDTDKKETASDNPDGSVETKKNGFSLRTITVVGQIEGHNELPQSQKSTKYELLIPQLVEIEENDEIDALLLILNTVGGDVEAGLALSELIAGMKKPTASLVLGKTLVHSSHGNNDTSSGTNKRACSRCTANLRSNGENAGKNSVLCFGAQRYLARKIAYSYAEQRRDDNRPRYDS